MNVPTLQLLGEDESLQHLNLLIISVLSTLSTQPPAWLVLTGPGVPSLLKVKTTNKSRPRLSGGE